MYFGAKHAWVPKKREDVEEEVYEDDINDGLESSAMRDEDAVPQMANPLYQQANNNNNNPFFMQNQMPVPNLQQNIQNQQQQQQQIPQEQHYMVNNSSNKFIPRKTAAKKKVKAATTNVIRLEIGKLGEAALVATGDPLYCSKCKSMFNSNSSLSQVESNNNNNSNQQQNGKVWKCEFCEESNAVEIVEEEIPKGDTVDYLLEPAPEFNEAQGESNTVIFVIDTSGSMCVTTEVQGKIQLKGAFDAKALNIDTEGEQQWMPRQNRNVTYISRLQCVQASVEKQIENFVKENPNKKIALVSFNSEVTIIGDGTTPVVTIGGDKLSDFEKLLEEGKKHKITNNIKKTSKDLINKLYKLEEKGTTALGPALVVALGIASDGQGNTIVLLTDGLANVGVGNMEDLVSQEQLQESENFFKKAGELAQANGTTVNITSIQGSECKMEYLGLVSEISNGEVDIVDPLQLTTNFANILSKTIVATECNLVFKVHRGIIIQDEQSENGADTLAKNIGNVTNDLTVTFEYSLKSMEDLKQLDLEKLKALPFQVQIYYKDLTGAKKVRCISKQQPITSDRNVAEEEIDVNVVSAYAVQSSAKMAQKGDYKSARTNMVMNQKLLKRNYTSNRSDNYGSGYSAYVAQASELDNALKEQEQDEEVQGTTNVDSNSRKTSRKDKVSKAIYQAKKWK